MKAVLLILSLLIANPLFAQTKCFLLKENTRILAQEGDCQTRHSPNSTFKIPISLMGFNEEILIDKTHPVWPFKEEYTDWVYIPAWKDPQTPRTWMRDSVVWYSQLITQKLGDEKFSQYVKSFQYGNQDVSGGLTQAWLSNSLKISPVEQVDFLQKLINDNLPVSKRSQDLTKQILFREGLPNGWKLYGKTGSGSLDDAHSAGWFVGWVEKGDRRIAFAHYIVIDKKPGVYAGPVAKDMTMEKLKKLL